MFIRLDLHINITKFIPGDTIEHWMSTLSARCKSLRLNLHLSRFISYSKEEYQQQTKETRSLMEGKPPSTKAKHKQKTSSQTQIMVISKDWDRSLRIPHFTEPDFCSLRAFLEDWFGWAWYWHALASVFIKPIFA